MKRGAGKRAPRTAPAEVMEENEAQAVEQVTFHPIPELLWNPDKPDEPHHSVHETVTIRVSRAVTGNGYSYLGETTPTDLPTEKELLARFGPGRYRLDGLTTKNTYVKSRVGICVGDFDQNPSGGVAGYRLPPAPQRSTAENVAGVVATIIGIVSPLLAPLISHFQTESARREQREREHTTQLMTMMQSIGTARNTDLEKLLQAALANLANPPSGGMGGTKAMQEMFVNMLDAQRATYTDLMATARETSADDKGLETIMAAFSGFTEAQKADALARLEEAKAKQAAAAAAATATEASNGMAAPH